MEIYIIDFFKKMGFYNESVFNSFNITVLDKDYEDIKDLVGFYPNIPKLILPKINTMRDILIWIHEYSHALFPDDDDEIFPNLMEAYFINDYIYDDKIVEELKNYTKREIENSIDLEHSIAKQIKLSVIK